MALSKEPAIEMIAVGKYFGDVQAINQLDLRLHTGEIHGIVGESGAGKSTLMAMLYGGHQADIGRIKVHGKLANIKSPRDAMSYGIVGIFGRPNFVGCLNVLENIALGIEGSWRLAPILATLKVRLERIIETYGLEINLNAAIETLEPADKLRIEIIRALLNKAHIFIFDEVAAALNPLEVDRLFDLLRRLRDEGKVVVFVTDKLKEIKTLSDRVSIIRNGKRVITQATDDIDLEAMTNFMIGRRAIMRAAKEEAWRGDIKLKAEKLRFIDHKGQLCLDEISFSVRGGEILGLRGSSGHGQCALLNILAGLLPLTSGKIIINRKDVTGLSASALRKSGLAYMPEPGKGYGLVAELPASNNLALGYHDDDRYGHYRLSKKALQLEARQQMVRFDVRPVKPDLLSDLFSKGNQQKMVLARECEHNPDILLISEPTQGVDVSTAEFIHNQLLSLRAQGKAIILVSSEFDELKLLADRVLVMSHGRIQREISAGLMTSEVKSA